MKQTDKTLEERVAYLEQKLIEINVGLPSLNAEGKELGLTELLDTVAKLQSRVKKLERNQGLAP